MATSTFKVSKSGKDAFEVSRDLPDNLNDPLWEQMVSDPDEDINSLALQAWTVKAQAAGRAHYDKGIEAVQKVISGYKYGARTGGFSAPTISAEAAQSHGFTEEQLAFLRSSGVSVPGLDDESDAADAQADEAAMAEA